MFRKLLRRTPKDTAAAKILRDIEHTAFFRISSVICAHKDLKTILEVIARESLNCLKANRSTISLLDQTSGILKIQFIIALDPRDEQVGLPEEEEVAWKALQQKRPLVLQKPKNKGGERKITSLMSIPLSSKDSSIGILSAVLINEDRRFNGEDLQLLSIFGNFASIAMEMAHLLQEVSEAKSYRETYQRYLDDILANLQGLSEEERQLKEEHIGKLMQGRIFDEEQPTEGQNEERVAGAGGTASLAQELEIHRHQDNAAGEKVQVELDDKYLSIGNLGGGAFILTSNPMELGEQFSMRLHLSDGSDPMEVVCKVIWTNRYGKEARGLRRGMGIRFLDPQREVQKRIEESIRSHQLQAVGEIMVARQGFNFSGIDGKKIQ